MSQNYYSILEIDKNASEYDIKKSYRKLAMIYHPDKNKNKDAEEKFKQISEAYQILSDKEKKFNYDNGIYNQKNSFSNPRDIFNDFFNYNINSIFKNEPFFNTNFNDIFEESYSLNNFKNKDSYYSINNNQNNSYTSTQTSITIENGKKIETIIQVKNGVKQKKTIITDLNNGTQTLKIE